MNLSNLKRGLTLATLPVLCALNFNTLAGPIDAAGKALVEENFPELFYQDGEHYDEVIAASATRVAEIEFADGRAYFMQLPDGSVGTVVRGALAWRAVDKWGRERSATALEIYGAIEGDLADAPIELWQDHSTQARHDASVSPTPRLLPGLNDLFAENDGTHSRSGGFSHDWFADSSACGDQDLDLFRFWFETHTNYDDWGAQGVSDYGEWFGEANITLGSTNQGMVAVCTYEGSIANLDIHEFVPGIGWVHVMDIPNFGSFAYGYIFQGYGIRKVRMTVRDLNENTAFEENFFWAGSY